MTNGSPTSRGRSPVWSATSPRPKIGILCDFDLDQDRYFSHMAEAESVEALGCAPLLLPYVGQALVDTVVNCCDGLVLTGGGDFEPSLYGATPHPEMSRLIPRRDAFELLLVKAVLEQDLPTLAICRGMQMLNVAIGGTIHAHTLDTVPGASNHRDGAPFDETRHPVRIRPGTELARTVGADVIPVNSIHHQSVRRIADGLIASAVAPDGVIEAVESPRHRFVLGVQWHPERIWRREISSRRVLERFVEASSQHAAERDYRQRSSSG